MASEARAEWWRGAVIYQIYPRSFQDTNGDGIGDLAGIIDRLDYVASLGVDGIWISPFFKSPMRDYGYDIADYCVIDPLFGDLETFDRLLEKAHVLGLKVIVDQVYSHTAVEHEWFQSSRRDRNGPHGDWYVWADAQPDGTAPNNWLARFGGVAWEWDALRGQYYMHNFLAQMPDVNFWNDGARNAMLEVAKFWLDRGVDGFRLDVANFYRHDPELRNNPVEPDAFAPLPVYRQKVKYNANQPENLPFLADLRAVLDRYPERMSVAEIAGIDDPQMMIDYTSDQRLHTAYSFALLTHRFDAAHVRATVEPWLAEDCGGWPSWAFSNHDVARAITRWGGETPTPQFKRMLAALLLSLRGTAFMYQGEELGLTEADVPLERVQDPFGKFAWPIYKGRDGCRTPMP